MKKDFNQKNYYEALGVPREATSQEIKRAYRQLAMQFHPDRNPGDKRAEEQFKEICEAYGVLIDPEKRRSYDSIRRAGFASAGDPGFRFTQEEIFRDIFSNPMASDVFRDLGREFSRMGFRFDERFFDHLFFGGRGVFFGEIRFGGPEGVRFQSFGSQPDFYKTMANAGIPPLEQIFVPRGTTLKGRFLSWLWRKVLGFLLGRFFGKTSGSTQGGALDLTFIFPLARKEAGTATMKEVAFQRNGGIERLMVKIPADVRDGTVLRLRGKGKSQAGKAGDLYLRVKLG